VATSTPHEHPIARLAFDLAEIVVILLVVGIPLLTVAVYYLSTH
jgi:hypothetical protein